MIDIEQAALEEAAHARGIINWDQFNAKYGNIPSCSYPPLVLFMTNHGMPEDMCRILAPRIPPPMVVEARSCKSLPDSPKLPETYNFMDVPKAIAGLYGSGH